jgi:uncharacterized Zn-binding protein involved in type VI secretion
MPPAARVTDKHNCPKTTGPIPHVGGPVLPTGEPTVRIGFLPAARKGDMAACVGPTDKISQGEPTVRIGGKDAARMGDSTQHGGKIVMGCPTVNIGSSAQAETLRVGAEDGTPFCEECARASGGPSPGGG